MPTRRLRLIATLVIASFALTLVAATGGAALAQGVPELTSDAPLAAPSAGGAPLGADPARAPFIAINLGDEADGGLSPALKIVLLFVGLTFVPALLLAMTSFTRIIVVLSLLRQGIGVMQLPPNRVLVALALFLTAFTMAPTFERIHAEAIVPYDAGQLDELGALDAAMGPLRVFMLRHTRESDLMLFIDLHGLNGAERPETAEDVPTIALIPAFILSELKTAFQMGALLFLPFLIIDIVVASILMSMGMMMLPPATISLPLKIIVFVAVDGWGLVIESLAISLTG